jgi:hypothetical protein
LGKHLSKEPINGSREVHEWCKAGDGMDSLLVPVRDEAVLRWLIQRQQFGIVRRQFRGWEL